MGNEEQLESREIRTAMWTNRFIVPLYRVCASRREQSFNKCENIYGSHCGCQSGSGSVVTWRRFDPSVCMINISA